MEIVILGAKDHDLPRLAGSWCVHLDVHRRCVLSLSFLRPPHMRCAHTSWYGVLDTNSLVGRRYYYFDDLSPGSHQTYEYLYYQHLLQYLTSSTHAMWWNNSSDPPSREWLRRALSLPSASWKRRIFSTLSKKKNRPDSILVKTTGSQVHAPASPTLCLRLVAFYIQTQILKLTW
jgi:hypothetical protein